jgi:hypothetical protein
MILALAGAAAMLTSGTHPRAFERPAADSVVPKSSMLNDSYILHQDLYAVSRLVPKPTSASARFAWQTATKTFGGYSARDALVRALAEEAVVLTTIRTVLGMRCPAPLQMDRLVPLHREQGI